MERSNNKHEISKRLASKYEIENAVNNLEKLLDICPVFMHCHAAVERSPLISVAFLMKTKKLNLIQAYEYVKQQNKTTNVLLDHLREI